MIQSFADRATEKDWDRGVVKRFGPELLRIEHVKLRLLNAAEDFNDLRIPPGNGLERLSGDGEGSSRSVSMLNSVSASGGPQADLLMLRSSTTTGRNHD